MGGLILHVSVVHRPDDPRIFERECRSLAAAGYDVTYLAPGAPAQSLDGVKLAPLPVRPRSRRWMDGYEILREVARRKPRVVHAHDPELLTLFPLLRPLVPRLVYDMHDFDAIEAAKKYYIPPRLRPCAPAVVTVAERALLALAAGVVVVTEDMTEVLGARPALRAVVPNYPRVAGFEDAAPVPELAADPRLKLIHLGSLTRERGIPLMLDIVREVGDEAVLYLGGSFPNPQLEAEVTARVAGELSGKVRLLGRVPHEEVARYLASADVVWVPWTAADYEHRRLSTTKLFEGLAAGLAALVSDLPGPGDVVRTAECGLAVPPDAASHLAGLRRLLAERAEVPAMGARGLKAVRERYSWEAVEHRLVDFYARLCEGL